MSCVWHVLMLMELPLSENVTISIIPHLHFEAVFQCNRQVETCFSATQTMGSVAMVFGNRSNENASCLL